MSRLENLTPFQEMMHENHKKRFPDKHKITRNDYHYYEMMEMCILCSEHYNWKDLFSYDGRTDRFYLKEQ